MIRGSVTVALIALGLSLGIHGGLGVSLFEPRDEFLEQGGASTARLGNSFQDVAASTQVSVPPEEVLDSEPAADVLETPDPDVQRPAEISAQDTPQEKPDTPVTPNHATTRAQRPDFATQQPAAMTETRQPARAEKTEPSTTPRAVAELPARLAPLADTAETPSIAAISPGEALRLEATAATPMVMAALPPEQAQPVTPPIAPVEPVVTPTLQSQTTPVEPTPEVNTEPPQTLIALPEPASGPAPILSARPAVRPRAIEDAAASRAEAARKAAEQAEAARKAAEPEKPRPQPANTEPAQVRGSDTGQTAGPATASSSAPATAPRAGNAAISNYPGLVNRAIARAPRPSMRRKGAVMVSFSIGANGRVASAGVVRSSGNATLDTAAVRLISRVRFPKPPAGARTTFRKLISFE